MVSDLCALLMKGDEDEIVRWRTEKVNAGQGEIRGKAPKKYKKIE